MTSVVATDITSKRQRSTYPGIARSFACTLTLAGVVVLARYVHSQATAVPAVFDPAALIAAAPLLALGTYCLLREMPVLATLLNGFGLLLVALSNAWTSTSLIFYSSRHLPMVDRMLSDADRLIGFDWLATLKWFDQHPLVNLICQASYQSILFQPLAIIAVLAATRQGERLYAMISAMLLALVVTTLIALPLPAYGPYEFLGVTAADHPHIAVVTGAQMTPAIDWLRAADFTREAMRVVPVGLISFPSFHTAAAVIYTWSLWGTRRVRWAFAIVNSLMLIATPVHGSHYLLDVIAGGAIAIAAIRAAQAVVLQLPTSRRRDPRWPRCSRRPGDRRVATGPACS